MQALPRVAPVLTSLVLEVESEGPAMDLSPLSALQGLLSLSLDSFEPEAYMPYYGSGDNHEEEEGADDEWQEGAEEEDAGPDEAEEEGRHQGGEEEEEEQEEEEEGQQHEAARWRDPGDGGHGPLVNIASLSALTSITRLAFLSLRTLSASRKAGSLARRLHMVTAACGGRLRALRLRLRGADLVEVLDAICGSSDSGGGVGGTQSLAGVLEQLLLEDLGPPSNVAPAALSRALRRLPALRALGLGFRSFPGCGTGHGSCQEAGGATQGSCKKAASSSGAAAGLVRLLRPLRGGRLPALQEVAVGLPEGAGYGGGGAACVGWEVIEGLESANPGLHIEVEGSGTLLSWP